MVSKKIQEWSTRIGALGLRERVLVFAAAVVVVFALVQTLLIDPAQLRKQTASARVEAARLALVQIEQQRLLLASPTVRDPDQAARDSLTAQETRLAQLSAELDTRERSLIPPARMRQVLKDVVQGHGGIQIVEFKTLSPQPVLLPDAAVGAPPGFYRHGFEVTVSGGYSELVDYLVRLEDLPWRLNWAEASLDAADRPQLTLTLTVHTLSLEEAWLRV